MGARSAPVFDGSVPPTILIIDDEVQIRRVVKNTFQAAGAKVVEAATGSEGIDRAAAERPDLIILDLGLPDMAGVNVCREIRKWAGAPILVLSARHSDEEKVALLDAGADDYVTKPFNIDELLARMRAITRRHGEPDEPMQVRIGRYDVDLTARDARRSDDPERRQHLTRTEWQLLEVLARNPGKLISHRQLLQDVWGPTYLNETHYLRQYVAQLRRKLEDDPARPRHLLTEPGMGYRFQP